MAQVHGTSCARLDLRPEPSQESCVLTPRLAGLGQTGLLSYKAAAAFKGLCLFLFPSLPVGHFSNFGSGSNGWQALPGPQRGGQARKQMDGQPTAHTPRHPSSASRAGHFPTNRTVALHSSLPPPSQFLPVPALRSALNTPRPFPQGLFPPKPDWRTPALGGRKEREVDPALPSPPNSLLAEFCFLSTLSASRWLSRV